MWDSSNDYRLKVAEKSVELFLRAMDGANLKGKWSKKPAVEAARKMIPEIQTLYFSYLSPLEMADATQIASLEEGYHEIIESLGGSAWNRQFLSMAERIEREKLEEGY
ncbi:MAG: hypothetical protein Q8N08_05275 [Methanobacteriaceae archaeon]|nr:hypothetical protein [Methanobacteriaceae archaeon]